jgi:hypothetical protein
MSNPDTLTCSQCEKQAKRPKRGLPRGWHRAKDLLCEVCWPKKYLLRAVTLPVRSPLDCSWEDLDALMKTMWRATTACSNWMISELRALDEKQPRKDKFHRMPQLVLYASARERFPELPAQSVVSIEQAIQRKYRAIRADVIWRRKASLPSFRYPTPFPVHNQSWHTEHDDTGRPLVSLRAGDQRITLRLANGHQFRRQIAQFKALDYGTGVRGELAVLRKMENGKLQLMVKMAGWFERKEAGVLSGRLHVRTDKTCLLVAADAKDGEAIWRYNADHLRRWAAEHRKNLDRWSEDQKFEQRPVADFDERRKASAQKYKIRMHSALHEIARHLVEYAKRRKFLELHYDGREKSYSDLQWFKLSNLISEKCNEAGILFVPVEDASGEAEEQSPERLAERET